ncbi:hypothetical protein BTM36_04395 [Herbaspirillum sp. VT-16-41]|nr:hypothetical protein BTM36_04395 [Herbaspirillum sp. VT-16-41]
MNTPRTPVKTIALALQGGGAHGAFTWGVLDRLLDDERIVIEGKGLGRELAERWLAENFKHLSSRSTLDFKAWQPVYH